VLRVHTAHPECLGTEGLRDEPGRGNAYPSPHVKTVSTAAKSTMTTTTVNRVPRHTSEEINRRIEEETDERVRSLADNPAAIQKRLRELDEEWDIERMLEANASALAFTGTVLGASVDRRWFAIPLIVGAFLFQHAIQGWCPPVPILRRLGFRTAREIEIERVALKTLRGDFRTAQTNDWDAKSRAAHALSAARL
jgi:hypothetical protein